MIPDLSIPLAVAAETEAELGPILLAIFIVFVGAKVAGEIAERLRQPAVVGELLAGVILGPSLLAWVPITGTEGEVMLVLAELGVIVLLFQVGLETDPKELRAVGGQAAAVGVLGVIFPFAGGFAATMIAGHPTVESAFVATALVATSVGITARVLGDLGKLSTRPSRIILGAAVIDDILGLVVLAIVVGLSAGALSSMEIAILLTEATLFVGLLLAFGPRVINKIAHLFEAPKIPRSPFAVSVAILLGLAVLADRLELAVIVGAFLAGSVLSATRDRYQLEKQFEPVADFLTPYFFVVTGARVQLDAFTQPSVLAFAAVITVIAVVGKLLGGYLGSAGLDKRDKMIVGVGMIPRGEVGIIVAGLALSRGVVGEDLFGAVLIMVVLTTIIAPPFLRPLFAARERSHPSGTSATSADVPTGD